MGTIRYPNPPVTLGKDPCTWPTAEQLTDEQLLHWLRNVENTDRCLRRFAGLQENRPGINKVHADLFAEAVARGLRNPVE